MDAIYRIIIAEDHTIVREGLKALLRTAPEFEVVGEASDGREAVSAVLKHAPDLVLMDLNMPRTNGLEGIREVKRCSPATRILILTVHQDEEHVAASLQAGADGYILKGATAEELLLAAKTVAEGKTFLSPDISRRVVTGYLETRKSQEVTTAWDSLTDREKQVLKMIAEGHKNKEIGDYLCIAEKTVERHRANLMAKLDLHSGSALTAYAIEKGLAVR